MFTSAEELLAFVKEEGIETIDCRFCDLPGAMQHFTIPPIYDLLDLLFCLRTQRDQLIPLRIDPLSIFLQRCNRIGEITDVRVADLVLIALRFITSSRAR